MTRRSGDAGLAAARIVLAVAVAAMLARTIYHVATGSDGYLSLQQDDFYYYAVTARNLALHGISSFDGFTRTNGYQPLWMAILTGLAWICNGLPPAFFIIVGILCAASVLATFEIHVRLGRELFGRRWFVVPAALAISIQIIRMTFWGMETAVVLPLYPLLLLRMARAGERGTVRGAEAAGLGLLASIVILARLDTAIFTALAVAGWLLLGRAAPREKIDRLLLFAAGGAPLLIYLLWNLFSFGALTPVSSQAKHLKIDAGFSTYFLQGLTWTWDGLATIVALPLGLLVPFVGGSGIRAGAHRLLAVLAALFPILFFTILGFASDWQLFGWYLYPAPLVMFLLLCGLGSLAEAWLPSAARALRCVSLPSAAIILLAIALPLAWRQTLGWQPDPNSIYLHARMLAPFARSHPGRYAMGDRAGLTALMIDRPVLHLEGLIADTAMVGHIGRQDRLNDVLSDYGIDYLIVSLYYPIPMQGTRYVVTAPEPLGSGMRSRRMTGLIEGPPAFTYISRRSAALSSPNQMPGDRSGLCYTYVFERRQWENGRRENETR